MYWIFIIYILCIAVVIRIYYHVVRHFDYWKNQNVPYLKPTLIFGNLLKFITLKKSVGDVLYYLHQMTDAPYFGFFIFDQPSLLIRNPEIIKLILIKDFDNFMDRKVYENKHEDDIGSRILFNMKNPVWRTVRTKVTPIFTSGKMKSMFRLMMKASDDLIDYINNTCHKENIDTNEMSKTYTTDVITSCAFGIDTRCFKHKNSEFRIISKRMFDWNLIRCIHMTCYFIAPSLVKIFRMSFIDPLCSRFLKDVFLATVKERETSGTYRGDLIDAMIKIRKEDSDSDFPLDDNQFVGQAVQFFGAGFETTGSTISFALYELSMNQNIQQNLRNEIKSFLSQYENITYESVNEMKYLDMVVCETLRKYPILPFIERYCTTTYKIPETNVTIDKGIAVYIATFGLHYDPKYYPNPEQFNPENFSEEHKKSRPPCTYLTFGAGLRNCIGSRFGILSTKVALIQILKNFEIQPTKNTPTHITFDPKAIFLTPIEELSLHFKPILE